jgi:hypothetical protein
MRLFPITTLEPRGIAERSEWFGEKAAMNYGIGMARGFWDVGARPLGRDLENWASRRLGNNIPLAFSPHPWYDAMDPRTGNFSQAVRTRVNRFTARHPMAGRALATANAGPRTLGQTLGLATVAPIAWAGRTAVRGGLGLAGVAARATPPAILGAGAGVGFGIGMGIGAARVAANQAANVIHFGVRAARSPIGRLTFGSTPAGVVWRAAGLTAAVAALSGAHEGLTRTWRRDDRRSPATKNFQNSTYGLPQALAS